MMRAALLTFGLLLASALTGCAAGPPVVDMAPVEAQSAERPLEWFAENWGPFDPSVPTSGRPLLLLDGRQVPNVREGEAGYVDTELPRLEPEQIRKVHVVRCGSWLFGEAGRRGVIMIFTQDYEGPMPMGDPRPTTQEDCRWR
ncbi:MAG TPA: hypothetical protein VJ925_10540 [Longimicrobiales bacterium]|nr:hypothetical protein [Longimicrobiales bacterium]